MRLRSMNVNEKRPDITKVRAILCARVHWKLVHRTRSAESF